MPLPIPKFIKTAFANIGLRNNIPEITNNTTGSAGYNQGFGEINMLPEGAGGIPPDGKDFNGIFYEITSVIQYIQSGATFPYNQDFADAIGGYDVGALVTLSDIRYVSTISGNSLPPPSAGWQAFSLSDPTEALRGMPLVATQSEASAGVNDNKLVTPKKLISTITEKVIGISQSWVDVTGSRTASTTYTNTTGRPIFVSVKSKSFNTGGGNIILFISGLSVSSFDSGALSGLTVYPYFTVCGIVPPGGTYQVSASYGISSWMELR